MRTNYSMSIFGIRQFYLNIDIFIYYYYYNMRRYVCVRMCFQSIFISSRSCLLSNDVELYYRQLVNHIVLVLIENLHWCFVFAHWVLYVKLFYTKNTIECRQLRKEISWICNSRHWIISFGLHQDLSMDFVLVFCYEVNERYIEINQLARINTSLLLVSSFF